MPTSLAQIQSDYLAIQFDPPPPLNPATVTSYLPLDPTVVVGSIEAEAYTQNVVNPVIREYQAAFDRVPDQGGELYWVQQFGTGAMSLAQISTIFANSTEFGTLYGGANATTPPNTALVTAMYENVLQRAPDAAGLAYWTNPALSGVTNAAQLLQAFAQSLEFITDTGPYIVAYQNLEAAGTPPTTGSLFAVPITPVTYTLTTGTDHVVIAANNSLVIGTSNGVGQTWTPGDTINGGTFTGNTFNLTDISTLLAGSWNPTSVLGNTVAGIQTANLISFTQAIQGDFTTTGIEGAWTGLTQLNLTSFGNGANVDNITIAPTTAVQITDTLRADTAAHLTVNGGSTVTITEANGGHANGGITVNGGSGTTDVSITQTATAAFLDGLVVIKDAGWAAGIGGSNAAGTITTVTLDGLHGGAAAATIDDNALANLTINDVASAASAVVTITDNLLVPTATTLALSLNNDGTLAAPLIVTDANTEISTLNLSQGNLASFLTFHDDGLTTVTLAGGAGAGTGTLAATFDDANTLAVNFDFSATTVNGDSFTVNRGAAVAGDTYSLGNAGIVGTPETLVITNTGGNQSETIKFGSGLNDITDVTHSLAAAHSYVNTANTGTSSYTVFSDITHARDAAASHDTLTFAASPITTVVAGFAGGANITTDINTALAATTSGQADSFTTGGNTYVVAHGDNSIVLSAADSVVELAGVAHLLTAATVTHNLIHLG